MEELPLHIQKSIIDYTNVNQENQILLEIIDYVFKRNELTSMRNTNICTDIRKKIHKRGLCVKIHKKLISIGIKNLTCINCFTNCRCGKLYYRHSSQGICDTCYDKEYNKLMAFKKTLVNILNKNQKIDIMDQLFRHLKSCRKQTKILRAFCSYYSSDNNESLNQLILKHTTCNVCKCQGDIDMYYVNLYGYSNLNLIPFLDSTISISFVAKLKEISVRDNFIHKNCIKEIISIIDTITQKKN